MTSQDGQSSPSSEILESDLAKRLYQQRVTVTITRKEADTLREMAMRTAASKDMALVVHPHAPSRGTMRRARRIWEKTEKAIETRDRRMRQKVYKRQGNLDDLDTSLEVGITTLDVDLGDRPLVGLGEE